MRRCRNPGDGAECFSNHGRYRRPRLPALDKGSSAVLCLPAILYSTDSLSFTKLSQSCMILSQDRAGRKVGRASTFRAGDSLVAAAREPGTASSQFSRRTAGNALFVFRFVTSGTRAAHPRRARCAYGTFQATATEELRLSYESASRQIGDARDKEMKSI